MPAFIVFEGIDGAGKTTLAKNLAFELGALLITTPPPPLDSELVRCSMNGRTGVQTSFLYFLLGDSLASEMAREARKSRFVVCDRYIHSTVIGHRLLGFDPNLDLSLFALEQPDISFFLFVSEDEERRRRIEARGRKTRNDILLEGHDFQGRYMDYFLGRNDFFSLDTNNDTPEESLAKIKIELARRQLITM